MTDQSIKSESDSGPGQTTSSDYQIISFSLITSQGNSIELMYQLIELNIYENIFSPVMSGDALIADGLDLIEVASIHGNEYISVVVDSVSLAEPITKIFRLYSIQNRSFDASGLANYKLHFCSEEAILSPTIKISKSYRGMRISQMIKDIALNYLKIKEENIYIEKSEGNFDLIVPYMDPLHAINWLSTRAYTSNKSAFMFYENRDKYHFISYENLRKAQPYATYTKGLKFPVNPDKDKPDDSNKNSTIFNFIQIPQDFNVLQAIRYGAYANRIFKFDLDSRSFETKDFNALYSKNKYKVLNTGLMVNDSKNRLGKTLFDSYESEVKYLVVNDTDESRNPQNPHYWMNPTISKFGQLTNFKMLGVLPGDVMLKCGMIVNVEFPATVPQEENRLMSEKMTCKYMLSSVTHSFSGQVYRTTVEMIVDSWGVDFPVAANDDSGLNEIKKT